MTTIGKDEKVGEVKAAINPNDWASQERKKVMKILTDELDLIQLPGQSWIRFPIQRIWAWGGVSEKIADEEEQICSPSSSDGIRWETIEKVVKKFPHERGYIGDVKIYQGKVWWNGWKSLEEIRQHPNGVLYCARAICAGASYCTAKELAEKE